MSLQLGGREQIDLSGYAQEDWPEMERAAHNVRSRSLRARFLLESVKVFSSIGLGVALAVASYEISQAADTTDVQNLLGGRGRAEHVMTSALDTSLHMEGILTPETDGGHENANAIVTGFEPADNFGLAQVIVGGERVEGDPGADMAVRAVLKDLNIPLASLAAQKYVPISLLLHGGGRMQTDGTMAFHGDSFVPHDAHIYLVQNTETHQTAVVMAQDAQGRSTALSDTTTYTDGDLHVAWFDEKGQNAQDGSTDFSVDGHLFMNISNNGGIQELALYVPWGTDENGQPRIHTIHARVAGGVRGPIIEPTPGVPEATPVGPEISSIPSELTLKYESPLMVETVGNVATFSVEVVADESLFPRIADFKLNNDFMNKDGWNLNQSWGTFTAMIMYKTSSFNGTFDEYLQAMSVAQRSNNLADWEKVASRVIKLNDMSTPEYDPKPTLLLPMSDVDFPDSGYRSFNKVVYVYTLTNSVDNITEFPGVSGNPGFGANLDGNTLYLYIGLSTASAFGTVNQTTMQTASLGAWLRTGIVRGESRDLQSILYNGDEDGAIVIVKK